MSSAMKRMLVLAFCMAFAPACRPQDDIQCYSTKARLSLPTDCGRCNAKPQKGENGLAHLNNYCGLEPQCKALQDAKLKSLYNRSVPSLHNPTALATSGNAVNPLLGGLARPRNPSAGSSGPLAAAQRSLVTYIIDHFYANSGQGFTSASVVVKIGKPPTGDDWCQVQREDLQPGQSNPNLWVTPEAFDKSPAFLVSCIGHELVHLEQIRRPKQNMVGIVTAVAAFRELEAWTWETGDDSFEWSIGSSKVHDCRAQAEKDENAWGINCYRWKVNHDIEELEETKKYLPALERWLRNDPWGKKWIASNAEWRSAKAGPRPAGCQ